MTGRNTLPHIGELPSGPGNAITDVAGVSVGHCTIDDGEVQTGVTVVRPHGGNPYLDRVPAASVVLNGFGKSIGLMQVEELGVLETPIAFTNTFAVGAVAAAQIRQCVAANPECGRGMNTVNPLVFECNDGYLNDIQRMTVTEQHYLQAWGDAGGVVHQGAVGAGRGMSMFGCKGGIGTASRIVPDGRGSGYLVGALVLSNYGRLPQLLLAGRAVGATLARRLLAPAVAASSDPEKGSIIALIATAAPLDARQLRRLALRAGAGLARTGSVFGHGSGDIALAFSTAYTVPQQASRAMPAMAMLHDALIDPLFQAAADATEQAIIHVLLQAQTVTGYRGHKRLAFTEAFPDWRNFLTSE
jgi:D-aminopeptidase